MKLYLLQILLLSLSSVSVLYGQTTFTATATTLTVTPHTSENPNGTINFVYRVINNSGTYTCGTNYTVDPKGVSIALKKGARVTSTTVATFVPTASAIQCAATGGGLLITGSFDLSNYETGLYTISPTINVRDLTNNTTLLATSTATVVTLGYVPSWSDLTEVSITPSVNSVKRTTSSASTYSFVRTENNLLATENGFIDVGITLLSTATSGSIFFVLAPVGSATAFTPTTAGLTYIEYRKTAATTAAVYVRNGITNATPTLASAFSASSRIRMEKSGSTINFLGSNSIIPPALGGAPSITGATGNYELRVYVQNLNDVASNILVGFPLKPMGISTLSYAKLNNEPEAGFTRVRGGKLRFYFEEEYAQATGKYLPFKIYDQNRTLVALVNYDGTVGATTPLTMRLPYVFDDNRYDLTVSGIGLLTNQFYTLEVRTSTNEIRYLKFQYIN